MYYEFIQHCRNGEIDMLSDNILYNVNLTDGFITACKYGQINMVIYLCNLYRNKKYLCKIDINIDDARSFRVACMIGCYDIVKYLCELYKKDRNYPTIRITACNEEAFRWACRYRHFNIVKYLMTLYKKHDYKPIKNYLMVFEKFDKYLL